MNSLKLFSVTNRKCCAGDFLTQIKKISIAGTDGMIIREKDLTEEAYANLAAQCHAICRETKTPLILHHFVSTARRMKLPVQLSIQDFNALSPSICAEIPIGVSIHSVEEATAAAQGGASWVIAGHIFETTCKPDLPPRGLNFLRAVCDAVSIPVYAIGGISRDRLPELKAAGATGCCVMSAWMRCKNPAEEIAAWRKF